MSCTCANAAAFADTELAATKGIQPIAFPTPEDEAVNRARAYRARLSAVADNAAFGERLRHTAALKAAIQNGHDAGHRAGWKAGYHAGLIVGIVGGAIATVLFGGLAVMAINLVIGRAPGVFA